MDGQPKAGCGLWLELEVGPSFYHTVPYSCNQSISPFACTPHPERLAPLLLAPLRSLCNTIGTWRRCLGCGCRRCLPPTALTVPRLHTSLSPLPLVPLAPSAARLEPGGGARGAAVTDASASAARPKRSRPRAHVSSSSRAGVSHATIARGVTLGGSDGRAAGA